MINFYELLGVSDNATKDEIKDAYRKMVKKYHPDINSSKEASKIIISLNEAKANLLDDDKRREYDRLLDGIKHSKEFSKEKENTYTAKTKEYKENYSEVYITRWQYFINYLKQSLDKTYIKIIKSILVIINYLIFLTLKLTLIILLYTLYIMNDFIDYIVGFMMILGILSLFIFNGSSQDYIPLIPSNLEYFSIIYLFVIIIELMKFFIFTKSTNVYAFFQNIQDKVFIKILTK